MWRLNKNERKKNTLTQSGSSASGLRGIDGYLNLFSLLAEKLRLFFLPVILVLQVHPNNLGGLVL